MNIYYGNSPIHLCFLLVEHHLRCHNSHSEDFTYSLESDNFHTLASISRLFSEDSFAPLRLPPDDLFKNYADAEDDNLAAIVCKDLSKVTDFRRSRNIFGNLEKKISTERMKEQDTAATVNPGAPEILLGDSVFALNNYEAIVLRLSKVSKKSIFVAIASLEFGAPQTGWCRDQAASEVEFLELDVRSLYRFCRATSKIKECFLVGKHCNFCEICTKQRLPLYFGW